MVRSCVWQSSVFDRDENDVGTEHWGAESHSLWAWSTEEQNPTASGCHHWFFHHVLPREWTGFSESKTFTYWWLGKNGHLCPARHSTGLPLLSLPGCRPCPRNLSTTRWERSPVALLLRKQILQFQTTKTAVGPRVKIILGNIGKTKSLFYQSHPQTVINLRLPTLHLTC